MNDTILNKSTVSNRVNFLIAAIDHGIPVSSGPGWNDPPAAALHLAKKAQKKAIAATNTVNAITSPITQPLAMGGGAEPEQPPPMGMGSNPGMPPPPQMNYGYQQPQQNYYGGKK